jgi:hypothetical protein
MMKKARRITPLMAALFLVPCAWAANQVVGVDGTVYAVSVVEAGAAPGATALAYSVLHPDGRLEAGLVPPTEDLYADREPGLVLPPGGNGPFLIWTRNDGGSDQVVHSRYTGTGWTTMEYLTSGARDHVHPQAGVDSQGTATIVWLEPAGTGSIVFATFDPLTGVLLSSPRNLLHELVRRGSPEWLGPQQGPRVVGGAPSDRFPGISPEGGNDTPAIPPCSSGNSNNCKKDSLEPSGGVILNPACPLAVAAVVKNRALSIGVLENGEVLKYYRSVLPPGAPAGYLGMLLQSLLDQVCQP